MFYESILIPAEPTRPFIYLDKVQVQCDVITCMLLSSEINRLNDKINDKLTNKINNINKSYDDIDKPLNSRLKLLHTTLGRLSYQHKYHLQLLTYAYESSLVDPLANPEEIYGEKQILDKETRYWERIWNMMYNLCYFDKEKKIDDILISIESQFTKSVNLPIELPII
jgi:hypothetical protein